MPVDRTPLGRGAAGGVKGATIYVCYYYRGSYVVILVIRASDELQTRWTYCCCCLVRALLFCNLKQGYLVPFYV